MADSWPCGSY